MERRRPSAARSEGGLYFEREAQRHRKANATLQYVRSGSTLLDCVNGGGWPLGRMTNVIGDRSTGKTMLGIEALANFKRQYPNGLGFYREAEEAFDEPYAKSIGLPDDIDFGPEVDGMPKRWRLLEEVYEDLKQQCARCKAEGVPGFYIIDSMDALSTKIDMARDFGEQTYRTDKPTQLGELFRKLTISMGEAQMGFMIISQIRANIGAMIGDKSKRSGGAALDFYATVIDKLAHLKQVTQTIHGSTRVTAVKIKVKNLKNKGAVAFRDCVFDIRFGYGINDLESCVAWLIAEKRWGDLVDDSGKGLTKEKAEALRKALEKLDPDAIADWGETIVAATKNAWEEIEQNFRPQSKKYG